MAFAHVRNASGSGAGSSASATYGATPTAGDLLVAFIGWKNAVTISAAPSGWTALSQADTAAGNVHGRLYYKIAGASEPTAPSWTFSGAADWVCILEEYSGSAPLATVVDVSGAAETNSGTTTKTSPSVDPSDAVERLLVYAFCINNDVNFSTEQVNGSATSVFERADVISGTSIGGMLADLIVASTAAGTYTGTAVAGGTNAAAGVIAMFRPAGVTKQGAGVITGTSTVAGAGRRTLRSAGLVAGASSVATVGKALHHGIGAIDSVSTVAAIGKVKHSAAGVVAAVSTVSVSGSIISGGVIRGAGQVDAVSTVTAVGRVLHHAAALVAAVSTVSAIPNARRGGAGLIAGVSTVAGVPHMRRGGLGLIAGASTVTAIPRARRGAAGLITSVSTVNAGAGNRLSGAGLIASTSSMAVAGFIRGARGFVTIRAIPRDHVEVGTKLSPSL